MKKYNAILRRISQAINMVALIFLAVSVFTIIINSGGTQKATEHTGAMVCIILSAFYCFFTGICGILKSRKIGKASFNVFLGLFGAVVSFAFAFSIYIGKPLFASLGEIWAGAYFYIVFCILFIVYALGAAINKNNLGREDDV